MATVLLNSISHAMLQFGVGISAGVVVDWLGGRFLKMRTPGALQTISDAVLELLEVSAQVAVGGVILGSALTFLAQLDLTQSDPSGGAIFVISYFGAQPLLAERLSRLTKYVRKQFLDTEKSLEKRLLEPEKMDGSRGRSVVGNFGRSQAQMRDLYVKTGQVPPHDFMTKPADFY